MAPPDWLKDLLKRLRKLLGFSSVERPKLRILEEWHNDGISVLRIADGSIPGCVDLWRIDRHYEQTKFFVCIINVQQLREELAILGVSYSTFTKSRGRGLVDHLKSQIQAQNDVLSSHYWITGWHREFSGTDPKGRRYRSYRTVDVQLLACDLQGLAGVFAGDRYAKLYAYKVIKQLAADDFRERNRYSNWQAAVKAIVWAEWVEGLSHSTRGGISPDHVLQPRKAKGKK